MRGPVGHELAPRAGNSASFETSHERHERCAHARGGVRAVDARRQLPQARERVSRLADSAQLCIEACAPAQIPASKIGRQQPAPGIGQRQLPVHGAQTEQRVCHHRHLGERLAQRDIERVRRRRSPGANGPRRKYILEDCRDPMADRRESRNDDADGSGSTILDPLSGPAGRGLELVVLTGEVESKRVRLIGLRLPVLDPDAELSEGGEQSLLLRRERVEARQQHAPGAGGVNNGEPVRQQIADARQIHPAGAPAERFVVTRPATKRAHLITGKPQIIVMVTAPTAQQRPGGLGIARRLGALQQRRLTIGERAM